MRRALPLVTLFVLAGCGSSTGPSVPTIPKAKVFHLAGFEPGRPARPHRPADVSFTIDQPSGQPLTRYKTGAGPHTGVHLIIVKDDLSTIIHRHPPIGASGHVAQPIDFPSAGPYRVLRCGDGTSAGCRKLILASIRATLKALGDDTSKWDVDESAEAIDYTNTGIIDVPDMPWQNRPTFQQVVQVTSHR